MLTLTLNYDHDLENPCQCDGWKVFSFCRRHASFKHPANLGLGDLDLATGLPKITNPASASGSFTVSSRPASNFAGME